MSREIEIWADWRELGAPQRMGHLRSAPSRGKEVLSFSYDQAWLDAGHSRQLDPDLRFFSGPQYLSATDRPNFGIFLDSSPDRWGRLLMQRREAAQAREEGHSAHRLQETDYLLGVHDEQRTGALRFKEPARSDAWQCDEPWMRTPPWASLRELEHASWKIQDESANDDPHYLEWLKLLMAPGSSLGGARPKAGVKDPGGDLWIAKFPGRSDRRAVATAELGCKCARFELTTIELQHAVGQVNGAGPVRERVPVLDDTLQPRSDRIQISLRALVFQQSH